ncbi:leucine-rich repeat domain-containing protein [Candidatus Palauibacter sp.]|uniref:leucine-rich repeat domain-containing protein n=1 Tax=Candidatus Palauibacter sp. TaxID=3101350 RepID=UPI003B01ED39
MAKRIRTTSGSSDFSRSARARAARSAALGLLGLAILSCGGGDTAGPPPGPPPPPPTATVPARITLDPETVAVVAGDTIRVRVRVLNDRAQPISDAVVTWAIGDPTIATVDATGLVTGLKEGNASLTATSGPVSNSAPVAVHSLDRATLMRLYVGTRGLEWTNNEGWGTDAPVGSWYGVTANANSRVTALDLRENGLNGQLPADLGSMAFLTELIVDANENLSGPIPFSLSELGLETLNYGGTMLCTVRDEGFQAWLNAVATREGEFLACNEERADLMKLYEAMGGESWTSSANWGTDAPLENWYGIAVDDSTGRVISIDLNRNNLSGEIPTEIQYFPHLRALRLDYNRLEGEIPVEIGLLTELRRIDIDGNEFTGGIPPEIGNLVNLEVLWMGGNRMSGPIPPELGNLASLEEIHLYEAGFDGSIPEEFGNLTRLEVFRITETNIEGGLPESLAGLGRLRAIRLYGNALSDPLPSWLGQLDNLRTLSVSDNRIEGPLPADLGQAESLVFILAAKNRLSGPLPPDLGDASGLYRIWVQGNRDLSGPLPESMTQLETFFDLRADDTELCMPQTTAFRTWLESVYVKYRIRLCGGEAHAEAYLTQAVQSRDYPVPLVAGEEALLRVFVASEQETGAMIPPVRATFFVDGAEVHVENIPAGSSVIPTEVEVGELDLSPHAMIPAEVIQPGLEMVVEVDPDGTLDPNLGVSKRVPESGRMAVDARAVPPLLLTLLPFVWTGDNDRGAATFVRTADAEDEFFFQTRTYLPVKDIEITRHASVTVDSNVGRDLLDDVGRIRVMEQGIGHWHGMIPAIAGGVAGVAWRPAATPDGREYLGKTAVSQINAETFAHELGHNMSLRHATCRGDERNQDVSYPHEGGRIGAWGWDPREGGSLVDPSSAVFDFMTYCDPSWVSDYYFSNALRWRLQDTLEVWDVPAATRTLLVTGGADADGALRLDPAFVVDAQPLLPRAPGPYTMTGRRTDGSELFSLRFGMAEAWDGDGGSGFTFALPVDPSWETELAALSVSGPGGSVEIAEGTAPPMAILRDPGTGQVRAIFRDLPTGPLAQSAAEDLAPEPGLEVMVSSGLPGVSAWRR